MNGRNFSILEVFEAFLQFLSESGLREFISPHTVCDIPEDWWAVLAAAPVKVRPWMQSTARDVWLFYRVSAGDRTGDCPLVTQ
jgi:hypothetical protein